MNFEVTFLKTSSFEFKGDYATPQTFYYLHVLVDGTEYCRLSLEPNALSDFSALSAGDIITVDFTLSPKGKLKVTGLHSK